MGKNKLFLTVGGETVLRRAVRTALAGGLDPLIGVVGHERARSESELSGLRCTPVFNEQYASGMNTSLRCGFQAVPDEAVAAVALLADMPFVTAEQLLALAALWRTPAAPLAITSYDHVIAPPPVYARAL